MSRTRAASVLVNLVEQFIASLDEQNCSRHDLKLPAMAGGSFAVHNARTNTSKIYPVRKKQK